MLCDLAFSSGKMHPELMTMRSPWHHTLHNLIDGYNAIISDFHTTIPSECGCVSTVMDASLIITSFAI